MWVGASAGGPVRQWSSAPALFAGQVEGREASVELTATAILAVPFFSAFNWQVCLLTCNKRVCPNC